ncbi:sensor histidine kinase [Bradymonas sediminis]|uniref:histidine kinase n=1 Tax=Bradymonas sediminis TaxID=1548548 RepID=A0A2Z4FIR8_9DELT|nr:ATP-binding protein [Bradymonas sediminis]AWV88937.1 hypothetical protein DN745_06115 [Bradymonas sediminis]TDP71946.1 HAMP domain-containing protein [Bradymonas sediminis]
MRESGAERRGFPGGLRAQLLLVLCLLITIAVALGSGAVMIPQRADLAPQAARQLLATYIALEMLVVLLLGYGFFTFLVVRPIRALGVASQRAAKGDLASPIKYLPRNEFGTVSRQFNTMLEELGKNREKLEQRLKELDQANRQLHEAQDSLIRSEKLASVGQLAAGVAHEVGNPLAAISGYLEILSDEDLAPEIRRDILKRSQQNVDRIRDTVGNLLNYSREESNASVEAVDLSACVDEAIHLVQAQPKAQNTAIDTALPAALVAVRAVSSEVVQVLVNLLLNAIDALNHANTDRPAQITLSADTSDPDAIILRVEDNGPGIPPEKLQRVFDPFFTTKDPGEGTGLGLAICLRLMRRVDGDIHLESTPGEGTVFSLVFTRFEMID